MLCGMCGGKIQVKDTYMKVYGRNVIVTRKRVCKNCNRRFISIETIENAKIENDYTHNNNKQSKE